MALLWLMLACGGGDKDPGPTGVISGTPVGAGTGTGTGTGTGAGTGTGTGSATGSSDAAFYASGTYDGVAWEADCYFDSRDEDWSSGLQCQDGIQFFIFCRPDVATGIGDAQVFQVWFHLGVPESSPGTYDLVGTDRLSMGNGYAAPLSTNSENIVAAEMVVDAVTPWTSARGSFSASWDQSGDPWAGDHYGEMTGTFDFTCP